MVSVKKGILWVVSTCPYFLFFSILLSMFFFYVNYVCLLALVCFLTLCPVSILSAYLFEKSVSVRCETDVKQVAKNQSFLLTLTIENSSFAVAGDLKVNIAVRHGMANEVYRQEISMPIPVHGKEEIFVEMSSPFCGNITVSVEGVTIKSIFNFITLQKSVDSNRQVLILPDSISIFGNLSVCRRSLEHSYALQKSDDSTEISGVREYMEGDLFQDIHWKLSAKREEILVKERECKKSQAITVLLELPNSGFQTVGSVLELYLAVVKSLDYCYACFVENGEYVQMVVASLEQQEELMKRVLRLEKQECKALDFLQEEEKGILYICAKKSQQVQDTEKIFVERGEAIALWL